MNKQELIEQLADKEHAGWAKWQEYVFSQCHMYMAGEHLNYSHDKVYFSLPRELVERWKRKINTPYENLSEHEKQSDREEAAHILSIIENYLKLATDERMLTILKAMALGTLAENDFGMHCLHCQGASSFFVEVDEEASVHEPDCPVLLARAILREMETPLKCYVRTFQRQHIFEGTWCEIKQFEKAFSLEEAKQQWGPLEKKDRDEQCFYVKDL